METEIQLNCSNLKSEFIMKLIPISAGNFHCDGGALFSVIPKKLWRKEYPETEDNITPLSLRCLLD